MAPLTSPEGAFAEVLVDPAPGGCAAQCGLLAEAEHRTANHFALLASYVRLKSADLLAAAADPDPLQIFLGGLTAQIQAMARIHRMLITQPHGAALPLAEVLHELCGAFGPGLGRFALVEDLAPDCRVGSDQVAGVSQIVLEAISNALKHARPRGAATLAVSCAMAGDEGVVVEVADNGEGLPPGFDPSTGGGLGLRLMRAHSRALKAQLEFQSADGLRMRLRLPARRAS